MKNKAEIVDPEILKESETSEITQGDKVTALTVRVDTLAIPDGSPAEQANALHSSFLHSAVSAKIRAVQCGWVLSAQRERIGYGQWKNWVGELDFSQSTAYNYINAYESTVGTYRRQQRRPLPLSVEPTMEEIAEATKVTKEKPLAALLRDTGVVENNPNHGGERKGAGRKPAGELPQPSAAENAKTIWTEVMAVLDKHAVMTAIPLLSEKVAAVCLDRVAELEKALRRQVNDLKGGK